MASLRPATRQRLAEIDTSYDEDLFVPETAVVKADPPAFTWANRKHLTEVLAEMAARKKEGLRLYRPYPNQEDFHRSRAKKKLAVGGNRGGKTQVCAVEVARALTRTDPHDKYPDKPLRCIFVGKDLIHCSKVMFRKLFKPGSFQMLKDEQTGEWRSFNPATDIHRESECRDSGALVPARYIKTISWENKKEETARTVKLKHGDECTFFSGEGEPPQGWDVDIAWLDEEIGHPKWYAEMVPRLVDRGGVLIWSFTPQIGSPAAYDLMNQADATAEQEDAPVQKFFFNIDTNIYISDERREAFKADMAQDEEEYRVRVEGKSALEGMRVYGEFAPNGVHKCPTFVLPEDWTRYAFFDPGRQVAAGLFFAVPEPHSQYARHEAICYGEIYHKKANAHSFAELVKQHVGDAWIQGWVLDMHGAALTDLGSGLNVGLQYADAFKAAGLGGNGFRNFEWGADDVEAGILAVKGKLRVRDGYPPFVFQTENLRWLRWEMERYSNQKLSRVNIVTDRPVKRHDHLCDCLRYAAQHPMPYLAPRKKKIAKSWTADRLKAKKNRQQKNQPGGGGVCLF